MQGPGRDRSARCPPITTLGSPSPCPRNRSSPTSHSRWILRRSVRDRDHPLTSQRKHLPRMGAGRQPGPVRVAAIRGSVAGRVLQGHDRSEDQGGAGEHGQQHSCGGGDQRWGDLLRGLATRQTAATSGTTTRLHAATRSRARMRSSVRARAMADVMWRPPWSRCWFGCRGRPRQGSAHEGTAVRGRPTGRSRGPGGAAACRRSARCARRGGG